MARYHRGVDKVVWMLVADLHHYLDLSDDIRGPARRLAEHLSSIVRAATAGAGMYWMSSLPCRRRPLLDAASERVMFAMRADGAGIVLMATDDELDELIGLVAAEADHETSPRRQKRLDAAFAALSDAYPGGFPVGIARTGRGPSAAVVRRTRA
jgi:hypothetical protein